MLEIKDIYGYKTINHSKQIEANKTPNKPPFFVKETSIFAPKPLAFPPFFEEEHDLSFALDVLNPFPCFRPVEIDDSVTDLVQIERSPSFCSYKRIKDGKKKEVEKEKKSKPLYI